MTGQNHMANKSCTILVSNHVRPVSLAVFLLEHNYNPGIINLRSSNRLEGVCESFEKALCAFWLEGSQLSADYQWKPINKRS